MARKESTKMSRAVSQLEHMYNTMNVDFFGGALPLPIITIQSSPRSYGHCTRAKVWKRKDENTYELNISAEALNEPIEEIIDTIAHEMVHVYCRVNDIKETSRGGAYHNKKFKELAEKIGLTCFETPHGWNTKPNDFILEYALEKGWSEFKIYRETTPSINLGGVAVPTIEGEKEPVRTSSTRKYICPQCGNSVRATKDVNIICADCMVLMIKN